MIENQYLFFVLNIDVFLIMYHKCIYPCTLVKHVWIALNTSNVNKTCAYNSF